MSTFGVMRRRVAREMKRGDIAASDTAVADAIISAIQVYKAHRFTFNEFHDEGMTASSSVTYVPLSRLAVTPVKIDTIKANLNSRDYPLSPMPWSSIDYIDAGQWYGYPDYYTIQGDNVRLYPPPNENMTLKLAGVKELPEISVSATTSATNAWMTDGEQMIRLTAKSYLFRDEVRNEQRADVLWAAAQEARRALQRQANNLARSGRVRVPRFV